MPRRQSRPISPAWRHGRLLGAAGMAIEQMKVILNSSETTTESKAIAADITNRLYALKTELQK